MKRVFISKRKENTGQGETIIDKRIRKTGRRVTSVTHSKIQQGGSQSDFSVPQNSVEEKLKCQFLDNTTLGTHILIHRLLKKVTKRNVNHKGDVIFGEMGRWSEEAQKTPQESSFF